MCLQPYGRSLVDVFKSTVKGGRRGMDGWSSSRLLRLGIVRQTAQLPKSAEFLNELWRHFPNWSLWHSRGGNSRFPKQSLNHFCFLFVKWPNLMVPLASTASVLNFFCIRISPLFARSTVSKTPTQTYWRQAFRVEHRGPSLLNTIPGDSLLIH